MDAKKAPTPELVCVKRQGAALELLIAYGIVEPHQLAWSHPTELQLRGRVGAGEFRQHHAYYLKGMIDLVWHAERLDRDRQLTRDELERRCGGFGYFELTPLSDDQVRQVTSPTPSRGAPPSIDAIVTRHAATLERARRHGHVPESLEPVDHLERGVSLRGRTVFGWPPLSKAVGATVVYYDGEHGDGALRGFTVDALFATKPRSPGRPLRWRVWPDGRRQP